ncbi:MAG TPA: tripartite tricarboxylate transporter substrate binding protein [Stellaceae bacterium]|nr:tripartite tricarboxylate transporter substrate binding protein [Stellaceae bacterium]
MDALRHIKTLRPIKTLLGLCLLLIALGLSGSARAENYPDRPIHLVVPFPPGGPAGVVAEVIGPELAQRLGQSVVIDHRSGADGIVGSEYVARAPPDGYTLLLASSSHVIHPGTYNSLPFDTETAFAPVSLLLTAQYVLVANPSLPVESLEELIAYAKSHPGALTYASGGLGGPTQLAFELFRLSAGISVSHVPYDGGGAALLAVVNGEAQVMLAPILAAMPMVQDGRLRALAVSGRHAAPSAPELPTIGETLPGFSAVSWFGVVAPAGTPAAVIARLNKELDGIVHEPETEKRFAAIGGEAVGGPPSTLASLIHDEIPRWRRVAKEAGIHIE